MLNDFVSATALNREQDFTRNVRVILRSTQELSLFALLASKDSDIEKIEDVKGKQIAISPNTIIEYVLDRMLGTVGLGHDDVEKVAVPTWMAVAPAIRNSTASRPLAMPPQPMTGTRTTCEIS